jgi:hypothetical protein
MKLTSLSPLLLASALAACGGDDGGSVTPQPDANTTIDAPSASLGRLVGTLTNVTFKHVMIGQDGETVVIDDGCVTKIDNATFSYDLEPAMGKMTQDGARPGRGKFHLESVNIAPGATCTVSTDSFGDKGALEGASAVRDDAGTTGDSTDDVVALFAPLEEAEPLDLLDLELWGGFGALHDGLVPGAYQIGGMETNFATCGVCVALHTNVSQAAQNGDADYFAQSGTVTLTTVGP